MKRERKRQVFASWGVLVQVFVLIGLTTIFGCEDAPVSTGDSDDPVELLDSNPGDLLFVQADETNEPLGTHEKPASDGDPVAVSLTVPPGPLKAAEIFSVSVVLDIARSWEIRDRDSPPPGFPTRLDLELPEGFRSLEEWDFPGSVPSAMPDGHGSYTGKVTVTRKVAPASDIEPGEYTLACSIMYQACNAKQCLRPVEHRLSARIAIQPGESSP